MVTSEQLAANVYNMISDIPDPEIPVITIRDLGILRGVQYDNGEFTIKITPTYIACPAMGMIEDQIMEILTGNGIQKAKVEVSYTPAWTTDWLSPEAREKLRRYGIAPPIHSACKKMHAAGGTVSCPQCGSDDTRLISHFGSTACKALYRCNNCLEPFDLFKCH